LRLVPYHLLAVLGHTTHAPPLLQSTLLPLLLPSRYSHLRLPVLSGLLRQSVLFAWTVVLPGASSPTLPISPTGRVSTAFYPTILRLPLLLRLLRTLPSNGILPPSVFSALTVGAPVLSTPAELIRHIAAGCTASHRSPWAHPLERTPGAHRRASPISAGVHMTWAIWRTSRGMTGLSALPAWTILLKRGPLRAPFSPPLYSGRIGRQLTCHLLERAGLRRRRLLLFHLLPLRCRHRR
jgi:hypothetical protein